MADTIHTTTCPTAVALAAPSRKSTGYATTRRHECIYSAALLPANVRVSTVVGELPPKAVGA